MPLQLLWLADTSFPSVFNNGITVELLPKKIKFPFFPMDRNIYVGWRNTAKIMRPLINLKSTRHRFLPIWVIETYLPILILMTYPLACFFPSLDQLINFSSFVMNKPPSEMTHKACTICGNLCSHCVQKSCEFKGCSAVGH